ncbi:EamA family transporter [Mucilaginibacter polytrichastri]|uniref:Inner membrane transporter rhtA n=1 Tax=Mucilaginibacter polytrichastri TaxID=1302689 RepID=A0A1Q5ZUA5_9SPHI|nr:DMT family transporter [Mucilaginibacter polytrichastri]OKS85354.1 Inner membrane transporter rhtA [Mucilaginibacter polytrichastri]SFS40238.1 inner membrane transporter RhtA [Mucilaginibacter polytrichastri]
MENKKGFEIPAVPAVLLSIVSVQSGAAIAKGIFPVLGATSTSSLRIGLSALILLLFNRPNIRNLSRTQWKAVALYGLTLGAMNVIFYMAIARIPLALGVALEFIGPLALALTGSKRMIDFVWVILAAVGIALIAPWHHNGLDITGVLLALLAGAFWAAYILLGGRISKIMDGSKAVTIGMVFASLVVLPIAIGDGLISHLKPWMLLSGFALALLSSAIPFTLEMKALKKIPAKTFSILMSLEPAVAAISGLVFLHEYLSLYEWLAVALIIIASAGATLTAKKAAPVAPES